MKKDLIAERWQKLAGILVTEGLGAEFFKNLSNDKNANIDHVIEDLQGSASEWDQKAWKELLDKKDDLQAILEKLDGADPKKIEEILKSIETKAGEKAEGGKKSDEAMRKFPKAAEDVRKGVKGIGDDEIAKILAYLDDLESIKVT